MDTRGRQRFGRDGNGEGEVVGGEMRQLKEGVRTERGGNHCT